jgi:hypothetical protein
MVKISKTTVSSVILSAVLFLSIISQCSAADSLNSNGVSTKLKSGTNMVYDISASATYRMYANQIKVIIKNIDVYPLRGDLQWMSGADVKEKQEDIQLVPYVIKIDKLEAGIANCPYLGLNTTNSSLVSNWVESTALTADNEQLGISFEKSVFADSSRNAIVLRYYYNYTLPNRIEGSKIDNITALIEYRWDMKFGILLKWKTSIENHNDSSMNGVMRGTLSQTNLWSLETETVPGYPLEIFSLISIVGVFALIVFYKLRIYRKAEGVFNA